MGTVCERSHIPLTKWLLAMHLMAASKKGMSAHQLHRMLGVTYKSAWFMAMRIREAMRQLDPDVFTPMGGEGKTAEADETYIGGKERNRRRQNAAPEHRRRFRRREAEEGLSPVMHLCQASATTSALRLASEEGLTARQGGRWRDRQAGDLSRN